MNVWKSILYFYFLQIFPKNHTYEKRDEDKSLGNDLNQQII